MSHGHGVRLGPFGQRVLVIERLIAADDTGYLYRAWDTTAAEERLLVEVLPSWLGLGDRPRIADINPALLDGYRAAVRALIARSGVSGLAEAEGEMLARPSIAMLTLPSDAVIKTPADLGELPLPPQARPRAVARLEEAGPPQPAALQLPAWDAERLGLSAVSAWLGKPSPLQTVSVLAALLTVLLAIQAPGIHWALSHMVDQPLETAVLALVAVALLPWLSALDREHHWTGVVPLAAAALLLTLIATAGIMAVTLAVDQVYTPGQLYRSDTARLLQFLARYNPIDALARTLTYGLAGLIAVELAAGAIGRHAPHSRLLGVAPTLAGASVAVAFAVMLVRVDHLHFLGFYWQALGRVLDLIGSGLAVTVLAHATGQVAMLLYLVAAALLPVGFLLASGRPPVFRLLIVAAMAAGLTTEAIASSAQEDWVLSAAVTVELGLISAWCLVVAGDLYAAAREALAALLKPRSGAAASSVRPWRFFQAWRAADRRPGRPRAAP